MSIYFDNNSTTAIILPVLQKHVLALKDIYGNPSASYNPGVIAKREVDEARQRIADLICADLAFDKIIFTSCATEANNAVFNSATKLYPNKKHIIVSAVEHPSVLEVTKNLKTMGYNITYVPVDINGEIDLKYLQKKIKKDTLIVSVMTANNETGVIYPITKIVKIVRECSPDILIHTDAVQAIGKIPINVIESGVDFLSISGHKFHAPKGVGALYIKRDIKFIPFLFGGHQEENKRAGTENTASIIAMGEAALYAKQYASDQSVVEKMRNKLEEEITALPWRTLIIGKEANRLANTSNIAFENESGYTLMLKLAEKDIFVSTGSACNSISEQPSHVIKAMGISNEYQRPIRISLSNNTKMEEIDKFIIAIKKILKGR